MLNKDQKLNPKLYVSASLLSFLVPCFAFAFSVERISDSIGIALLVMFLGSIAVAIVFLLPFLLGLISFSKKAYNKEENYPIGSYTFSLIGLEWFILFIGWNDFLPTYKLFSLSLKNIIVVAISLLIIYLLRTSFIKETNKTQKRLAVAGFLVQFSFLIFYIGII